MTAYTYDVNGNLTEVDDTAIGRVLTYQTDSFGQVLTRKETNNGIKGAYRNFFYLNGHGVGDVGTDILSGQTDYAQQLAVDRQNASRAGQAMYTDITATPTTSVNATFDETYQAYNATSVGQSAGGYVVMAGDTLQSIAQAVWGDSALWYVLADANGLSAGSALIAGQSLIVPNTVINIHNSSGVFKPYNSADALSNTTPTLPQEPQPPAPKQHGCGVVGDIIAAIVGAVVEALVRPWVGPQAAAGIGDAAKQLTRMAVGNQKKFDWNEVRAAEMTAGLLEMLHLPSATTDAANTAKTATGWVNAAVRGMARNVVQQGVNMAVGVQKKFDWAGLAAAGVSGAVAKGTANWLGNADKVTAGVLTGGAAFLATAATRTIVGHDSFGKSLMSALPDAIGNTIGGIVADDLKRKSDYHVKPQEDDGGYTPSAETMPVGGGVDVQGGTQQNADDRLDVNEIQAALKKGYDEARQRHRFGSGLLAGDGAGLGVEVQELPNNELKLVWSDGRSRVVGQPDGQNWTTAYGPLGLYSQDPNNPNSRTEIVPYAKYYDGAKPLSPSGFVAGSSSVNPVDDMGQPLYGRSHYNGDVALGQIISNAKNVPLTATASRLWRWFTYTTPDAKQRREESSWVNPRLAQLDQLASSPFGALGYDVATVSGADERTKQFALDMGSSFEGLVAAGTLSYRSVRAQSAFAADSAALRSRVLGNIADSQTARASSNFGTYATREADIFAAAPTRTPGTALRTYWPPNDGFLNEPVADWLSVGSKIDRYGYPGGSYLAPEGTPAVMRALEPGTLDKPYNVYEVLKPTPSLSGPAAPWFGQPGGGVQYKLPMSVQTAIDSGYIKRVGP